VLLATSLNVFWDEGMTVCPEEGIDRCAQAGFEALDFNFTDYNQSRLQRLIGRLDAGAYARSLCIQAEHLGLCFVQMHGPIFNHLADRGTIQTELELSHECLRWAAELGVEWVVFHPETEPGPFDHAHLEMLQKRNAAFFRELLGTSESLGVGIAVENASDDAAVRRGMRRLYCSTPQELIELVDALHHPLAGICWDTGHAHIQHLDQYHALCALGHRLKATHIQDNDGNTDQHLLPYHGSSDWHTIMKGLRDSGYVGAFCYEVHNAVRFVPDSLRDQVLHYAVQLGRYLIGLETAQAPALVHIG
jgi:L-ribulose-5-phosphate 3-epimerase